MPVCTGGNQRKAGVPSFIRIDPAYYLSILPADGAYLAPILPFLPAITLDMNDFCAAEPPSPDPLTGEETWQILTSSPFAWPSEVGFKVTQILHTYLWYRSCECITGTQPTAPAFPAAPADLPVVNPPGLVTLPLVQPCKQSTTTHNMVASTTLGGGGIAFAEVPARTIRLTVQRSVVTAPGPPIGATVSIYQLTTGDVGYPDIVFPATNNTTQVITRALPPNAWQTAWVMTAGTGAGTTSIKRIQEVFCTDAVPGSPIAPCCPPDANLLGALNNLTQLVTLIQRQQVPFAYLIGLTHTGLTGTAEIATQGVLGIALDVTTIPSSLGSSAGTPVERYGLGYVTLGTSDGWLKSRRIDHTGLVELPPAAGMITRIGYSLVPGVVATIKELVREP